MLTKEEKAQNDILVLDLLTKADGTKIESIRDGLNGYWLLELINDEPFIQRNAMPEEIAAYKLREAERQRIAEELEAEQERLEAQQAAQKATRDSEGIAVLD